MSNDFFTANQYSGESTAVSAYLALEITIELINYAQNK